MENAKIDKVNQFAPPGASVEDVGVDPDAAAGQPGSRWRRFSAFLIDYVLIFVGYLLLLRVTGWTHLADNPFAWSTSALVAQVLWLAVFLAVNGYLLVARGQTIGKLLTGMRIVDREGQPMPAARMVALRYGVITLLEGVPFIGIALWFIDCLWIFGPSRRCLHDHLAGTIVVRA